MIGKHESLPDALNRMADGLDRQASTIPSSMPQHINKLLQDSVYLRKAAAKIKETQSDMKVYAVQMECSSGNYYYLLGTNKRKVKARATRLTKDAENFQHEWEDQIERYQQTGIVDEYDIPVTRDGILQALAVGADLGGDADAILEE